MEEENMGEEITTEALAGICLLGPGQSSHRWHPWLPETWNFHPPGFPLSRPQLLISRSGLD